MKYRLLAGLALLVALVAGAWMALRPPELPDYSSPAASAARTMDAKVALAPVASKLSASTVLSIDPRAKSSNGGVAPMQRTLFNEYLGSRHYRALYDRLKSSAEGETPEGRYVLYDILRKCATVTERTTRQPLVRTNDQKREDFVASLPASDPQRDKRISAFDEVATNRCAGMEGVTITQADLNKLLANAAAGGDAKAQALVMEQDLWAQRRASGSAGRWGRDSVTLSDTQVDSLH